VGAELLRKCNLLLIRSFHALPRPLLMPSTHPVPIVDLFAGPGGLAEGFSQYRKNGIPLFKIVLSIEKDKVAHRTLLLRAFYRQFPEHQAPKEYYSYLAGQITRDELFRLYPVEATKADNEAWNATLGVTDPTEVDRKIAAAIGSAKHWVLIGGPPCQAYSMVGRARVGGLKKTDKRAYLYEQYLRILAKFRPTLFVMENVKGILSAKIDNLSMFDKILEDLRRIDPGHNQPTVINSGYEIHSFVPNEVKKGSQTKTDFVIRCETFGLPQSRHRVILLGIRNDYKCVVPTKLKPRPPLAAAKVLRGLPRLRGGITKVADDHNSWLECLRSIKTEAWLSAPNISPKFRKRLLRYISLLSAPRNDRGAEVISAIAEIDALKEWYLDSRMKFIVNHASRAHIAADIHRYFFAASYAKYKKRTPFISDFPVLLLPLHKNVWKAMDGTHFPDRFRVVVSTKPSTTITSHIGKDGHYYIHPDPTQARSLTVREAARLQTFPDNYLFEGNRTEQYIQVGNAVPPLLALQIAECVAVTLTDCVSQISAKHSHRT